MLARRRKRHAPPMLAFTFPGQGSQRPGMGRPWADTPSWELVEEASDIAERDVARLLLDADAEELKDTRNAQLTTFVLSLIVLDAVERVGIEPSFCAGHSLGEYTALTATGAARLRRRRTARHRARGRDARGRRGAPGHDGRGARSRRRPGRGGLPARRQRRLGGQLQRPRSGRDRRIARRRGRGVDGCQGARRQEGDAAARVRRVPHPVHGSCARAAAPGDRRSGTSRLRGSGRLQRRRQAARRRLGVVHAAVRAALQPRALEAGAADARRPTTSPTSPSSGPAAC